MGYLPWRKHTSTKEKAHRLKVHHFPNNIFYFGPHLEVLDTEYVVFAGNMRLQMLPLVAGSNFLVFSMELLER